MHYTSRLNGLRYELSQRGKMCCIRCSRRIFEREAARNRCAKDGARYSTWETTVSATPIRLHLRENADDASDGVALLFAAIFGVVRLLD